jgi:3-hydroxyacyl-[acyl-carrier-protein] dehydratase
MPLLPLPKANQEVCVLHAELDRILRGDSLCLARALPVTWQAVYALPEDFIAFQGHFPAYPILPAFMQICMAQHVLSLALRRQLVLVRVGVAKFTGRAGPGTDVQVTCSAASAGAAPAASVWDCGMRVYFRQETGNASGTDISKFRLFFED